ncbi:MAG: hypothetical protein AB1896_13735 [Thermodesulfobacteriota bacterium]
MTVRTETPAEVISVQGLVIPAQWDGRGRVVGVMIAAFDEREYQVRAGTEADALLGLIHQEVAVVGRLLERTPKGGALRLEEFRVVSAEETEVAGDLNPGA